MKHNRSTYVEHKCRCDVCRAANTASSRQFKATRSARVNIPHKHMWRKNGNTKGVQRVICGFCGVTANERDVCPNQ